MAYPGRDANFDSNSQVPSGFHNGQDDLLRFRPLPEEARRQHLSRDRLVLCHGDFLNADHEYMHKNKNVKGFGSYGDIMIRDRKMYVVPTPFHLVEGVAHQQTLILPATRTPATSVLEVGELRRREAAELIVGYSFDLQTNELIPKKVPNPGAGREHVFRAWRLKGSDEEPVAMRAISSRKSLDCRSR